MSELDKFFKQQGLDVLSYTRLPIHDDLAKPWTEMQLMATWDVNEKVLVPAALKDPSASPSAKEWRQMYGKVVEEVNQGMSIRMDMIVVVGKKGSWRRYGRIPLATNGSSVASVAKKTINPFVEAPLKDSHADAIIKSDGKPHEAS